jgi:hypothetical protein
VSCYAFGRLLGGLLAEKIGVFLTYNILISVMAIALVIAPQTASYMPHVGQVSSGNVFYLNSQLNRKILFPWSIPSCYNDVNETLFVERKTSKSTNSHTYLTYRLIHRLIHYSFHYFLRYCPFYFITFRTSNLSFVPFFIFCSFYLFIYSFYYLSFTPIFVQIPSPRFHFYILLLKR